MKKWWLVLSALKPERMLISHAAMYIAILSNYTAVRDVPSFFIKLGAFLAFYGSIYMLNDIADIAIDKKDPHNKKRLITSGALTKKEALLSALIILGAAMLVMYLYSRQLFLIALLLLGINMLYTKFLKSFIAYFDILFIAITHPIKYLVGLAVCGVGVSVLPASVPFLAVVYLAAVSMHSEKQLGKLAAKKLRIFKVGTYSISGLALMENIALVLSLVALLFTFTGPVFWGAVLIVSAELWLRFAFTAKNALSFVDHLERTFQPR